MKSFGICCFSSNRSLDAAGQQNINYGLSVIAPFDLDIMVCGKANNYRLPSARSTMEENHDLLQLETKGTAGSFFSRLLTREESSGNSSRIYYRAPHLGGVPFKWETEPGKRKSSARYYDELVHHEIIPPLSPPPLLQAKSAANSPGFCSRRVTTRVGLLHKIYNYFQQHKSSKAKSKQMGSGNGKNRGRWLYSDWEIYGAEETEIDGESDFSNTSFGSSTRVRMI